MTNPQYGGLLDAITEAVDIQAELDCSVEQARVVQHQPAKPQPKPDIKAVPVQTAAPFGGSPGAMRREAAAGQGRQNQPGGREAAAP